MASKKVIKSNKFFKQPLQTPHTHRPSQNRPAAGLTGRFLAGGEISVREKRPASILEVWEAHSSPKLD